MATALIQNASVRGSVRFENSVLSFLSFGDEGEWTEVTRVGDGGSHWSLGFGSYGAFGLQKGVLQTLDKKLRSLFKEERTEKKKRAAEARRQQPKHELRAARTGRKAEARDNTAWNAFLKNRIEAQRAAEQKQFVRAFESELSSLNWVDLRKEAAQFDVPVVGMSRKAIVSEMLAMAA